jgi:hypothetical protein
MNDSNHRAAEEFRRVRGIDQLSGLLFVTLNDPQKYDVVRCFVTAANKLSLNKSVALQLLNLADSCPAGLLS